MSEEKKHTYEDFRATASDYGDQKEATDFLTDPAAIADAGAELTDELAVNHGKKLEAIRKQKGLSLQELSEKTGIEANAIEQLESGQGLLPLGQLMRLSKALSMKISDVVATGEDSYTIVRSGQRPVFSRFGKSRQTKYGYEYESLAPTKKDRLMEPFIVTLKPSAADKASRHDGQEFIYVLEGEMEIVIDDQHEILKSGDSVYYDSSSLHLVKAHGDKPAKILAVLVG